MLARGLSFLVWAAVAASALYWGLQLFVTPQAAPAHTQSAVSAPLANADMSKLFGIEIAPLVAAPTAPTVDARFQLVGVVAPRSSAAGSQGVALIAIDGKPARAYRVGAVIDGATVLQAVQSRGAVLGPRGGAPLATLRLPPLPVAATGSLPGAVSGGTAAPPGMSQALPQVLPQTLPQVMRNGFVQPGPGMAPMPAQPNLQPSFGVITPGVTRLPSADSPMPEMAGAEPPRRVLPLNPGPSAQTR